MAEKPSKNAAAPKAKSVSAPIAKSETAPAAAKPSTVAPAKPTATVAPAVAPKTAASPAPVSAKTSPTKPDAQRRVRLIEEAAYYRSLARGVEADPMLDWLAAEIEVDSLISMR